MLDQCLKRFVVSSGIWLVLVCVVPSLVAQSPEPPYRVPVVGEDAVVHAGPGSTLYGTDRLPPGTLVDVYRHDPGGWMAIRPPEGSFSLVQRDEVDLLPNGLARIKANETVAWVGTRLTAVEDPTWQVRLDKGELVEVLGVVDREKFELGDGEPDWVQIMPPKGEFRWIAGDQLDLRQKRPIKGAGPVPQFVDNDQGDRTRGLEGQPGPREPHLAPPPRDMNLPTTAPGDEEAWTIEVESPGNPQSNPNVPSLDTEFSGPAANRASPDRGASGWQPARQTIANFVQQRSEFESEVHHGTGNYPTWQSSIPDRQTASHIRSGIFNNSNWSGSDGTGNVTPVAANLPLDLATLEMQMAREMLKQSPEQWNLQSLDRDTRQLRDSSNDAATRAGAERLLQRIRECREIQAGFQAVDGPGPGDQFTGGPSRNLGQSNPSLQAAQVIPGASTELLHSYDAFGWLNELVRDGGMGPTTYVLQDDQGRITHHITAPPGLNLRRYLKQRVGIMGSRGFNQQLNLHHVTAERVIAVDQIRR